MNPNKRLFALEELAIQYAKYCNNSCWASATNILEELRRQDKLNKIDVEKQPDNQMVFDFHKEVASMRREQEQLPNNVSVKDEWKEAYETGYRIGEQAGLKQGLQLVDSGVPGVPNDYEEKK